MVRLFFDHFCCCCCCLCSFAVERCSWPHQFSRQAVNTESKRSVVVWMIRVYDDPSFGMKLSRLIIYILVVVVIEYANWSMMLLWWVSQMGGGAVRVAVVVARWHWWPWKMRMVHSGSYDAFIVFFSDFVRCVDVSIGRCVDGRSFVAFPKICDGRPIQTKIYLPTLMKPHFLRVHQPPRQ